MVYNKKYYKKNKDKWKKTKKQKEERKEWYQEYRKKNLEKVRKKEREYSRINREIRNRIMREWRKKNRDKYNKMRKENRKKYPQKASARNIASKRTKLKSACEICGSKTHLQRHHWRYDKPLLINTLCRDCHTIQHIKFFNKSKYV